MNINLKPSTLICSNKFQINFHSTASLDELRELPDDPDLIWDPYSDDSIIPYSSVSPTQNPPDVVKKNLCNFEHAINRSSTEILWTLKDFANAGKLMQQPPRNVNFYDEYEMRKVYSLIYDVFRCEFLFYFIFLCKKLFNFSSI